ncbi:hypothetical protein [Coleofasciculus sp. F4-SAH-05]|uniref:hypothetical protein n=1 Tax=Coleofasciculus sp. F4-SAH-05 TaxID=3069525 RepID=UPI004062B237
MVIGHLFIHVINSLDSSCRGDIGVNLSVKSWGNWGCRDVPVERLETGEAGEAEVLPIA